MQTGHLALGTLLRIDLPKMLLSRPRFQQLVAAPEVRAAHASVPGRVAWVAPVEAALGAGDEESRPAGSGQGSAVDQRDVVAARTGAPERVDVGVDEELNVAGLVGGVETCEDLVAVHARVARTDALDLQRSTGIE